MGGVEVANGSTLSTTGLMQVTCNVPYVLSVDGVEWVPTMSDSGVDTYLLSTSGILRIYINGTRYFYFVNSLSLDFGLARVQCIQRNGTENLEVKNFVESYVQGTFVNGCNTLLVNIYSSDSTSEELSNMGITINQGSASTIIPISSNTGIQFPIYNVDPTQYLSVFCGNVLVAFYAPVV